MATQIDYTRVTPNIDIQAARNGIEIDVSKRGLRGPRGEQGPGVGETVASITSGRGFWPLRKALAAGTARVVAMGDSKTEGAGVETVDQRWLDQLMGTLRARYAPDGDQGLGYLPAYYATFYGFPSAPTTSGSAVTVGNGGGLGNRSRHLEAGGSVTWTVPAWKSGVPLLVHWTQHPGLGSLQVVTGGTVRGTIATGGSTIESKVTAVTIPAGTTSITVRHQSGTGTGNAARVEGIVHRTATTGVTIYDGARSGAKLVDYSQGHDGAPLSDDWHFQALAAVQPHAVILAFGANDQASRTPAQWGTDLRTVVDKAKAAAPGAGIIVLHGAQRTEDVTADPMRVLRFEAAARAAVGADPDVTILYESTLWKPTAGVDYTSSDPSGWLADTVHTGPEANAQIARYLAAQVTSADAATDAVEVASEAIKPAVTAAQEAQTTAQEAQAAAASSATLAQQAQAAAYEVPDVAMRDIITNPATETRSAITALTFDSDRRTQFAVASQGSGAWYVTRRSEDEYRLTRDVGGGYFADYQILRTTQSATAGQPDSSLAIADVGVGMPMLGVPDSDATYVGSWTRSSLFPDSTTPRPGIALFPDATRTVTTTAGSKTVSVSPTLAPNAANYSGRAIRITGAGAGGADYYGTMIDAGGQYVSPAPATSVAGASIYFYGRRRAATAAGAVATYITPPGSTRVGIIHGLDSSGGFATVAIDGDLTRATDLPTAQTCVDMGEMPASALTSNGGSIAPTTRVLNTFLSSSGGLYGSWRSLAHDLPPGAHEVTITTTTHKQAGSAGATLRIAGWGHGSDTTTMETAGAYIFASTPVGKPRPTNEFAIEVAPTSGGAATFLGGFGHGYENADGLVATAVDGADPALADGARVKVEHAASLTRQSFLVHPVDTDTPVAHVSTTYTLTRQGLVVNNVVDWLVGATIDTAYMAMWTPGNALPRFQLSGGPTAYNALALTEGEFVGQGKSSAAVWWQDDGPIVTALLIPSVEKIVGGWSASSYTNVRRLQGVTKFYPRRSGTVDAGDRWASDAVYIVGRLPAGGDYYFPAI